MYKHRIRSYEQLKKYDGLKSYKTTVRTLLRSNYTTVKQVKEVVIPEEKDVYVDMCFLAIPDKSPYNYLYVVERDLTIKKFSLQKGVYY